MVDSAVRLRQLQAVAGLSLLERREEVGELRVSGGHLVVCRHEVVEFGYRVRLVPKPCLRASPPFHAGRYTPQPAKTPPYSRDVPSPVYSRAKPAQIKPFRDSPSKPPP